MCVDVLCSECSFCTFFLFLSLNFDKEKRQNKRIFIYCCCIQLSKTKQKKCKIELRNLWFYGDSEILRILNSIYLFERIEKTSIRIRNKKKEEKKTHKYDISQNNRYANIVIRYSSMN